MLGMDSALTHVGGGGKRSSPVVTQVQAAR